jgi:hypothetical protein
MPIDAIPANVQAKQRGGMQQCSKYLWRQRLGCF